METVQLIGYAGALVLGLVMGSTGSGGSALAVPMFNYLFLLDMHSSTAHALFVVGTSALAGVLLNLGKHNMDWRLSLLLSAPMLITVFLVRNYVLPSIPKVLYQSETYGLTISRDLVIMLLFGLMMALAALLTIRDGRPRTTALPERGKGFLSIPLFGVGIGVITGITGTGGGFLIVPVLLVFLGLPMKKAVSTSLMIIALKSFGGFLGDLGNIQFDWVLLLSFTAISLTGMILGIQCSHRINDGNLKKGFGYTVLCISLFVFYKELSILV